MTLKTADNVKFKSKTWVAIPTDAATPTPSAGICEQLQLSNIVKSSDYEPCDTKGARKRPGKIVTGESSTNKLRCGKTSHFLCVREEGN